MRSIIACVALLSTFLFLLPPAQAAAPAEIRITIVTNPGMQPETPIARPRAQFVSSSPPPESLAGLPVDPFGLSGLSSPYPDVASVRPAKSPVTYDVEVVLSGAAPSFPAYGQGLGAKDDAIVVELTMAGDRLQRISIQLAPGTSQSELQQVFPVSAGTRAPLPRTMIAPCASIRQPVPSLDVLGIKIDNGGICSESFVE